MPGRKARPFSAQTQLRVGRLTKAHGLKGGLKVELYTDDPGKRFTPGATFALQVPDESPWHGRHLELTELRWYNGHPVGFFEGVADRTGAESLARAILWVDQDPAEPAEDDAWYDHQLVGLDVVRDGKTVGVIDRLEHLPAQDLLVVRVGEREVLVPFVRAIVPEVDLDRRRVLVSPPEGLFEELPDEPAPADAAVAEEDPPVTDEQAGSDPVSTEAQAAAGLNGGVPVTSEGEAPAVEEAAEPRRSTAAEGVPEHQRVADIEADGDAERAQARAAGIDVTPGDAAADEVGGAGDAPGV